MCNKCALKCKVFDARAHYIVCLEISNQMIITIQECSLTPTSQPIDRTTDSMHRHESYRAYSFHILLFFLLLLLLLHLLICFVYLILLCDFVGVAAHFHFHLVLCIENLYEIYNILSVRVRFGWYARVVVPYMHCVRLTSVY